ncbi:MAG: hypothetical protein AUK26_06620 [Syntrophaceae bacterium CG2_30_58_14]|nr:MAG: hypothetical protein AUK26_06620 [Syntrophaceae bacterium CG2_30_58_14]
MQPLDGLARSAKTKAEGNQQKSDAIATSRVCDKFMAEAFFTPLFSKEGVGEICGRIIDPKMI